MNLSPCLEGVAEEPVTLFWDSVGEPNHEPVTLFEEEDRSSPIP
jgi:hypothetical protein